MTSRFYVVATPIGNLSDLGARAAEVLRAVDVVAAEDTRVTRVLLRHVGSNARTIAAHEHNARAAAEAVLVHLREGRSVALVSDAGTPAISDPGSAVVAAVHEAGFPVVPIPGPNAAATLLSAAGLSDAPFLFEGFLPARARARDERLDVVARAADAAGALLVLFEAPHRIEATLAALAARFGERRIAIGRELTKTFEEVHRCAAAQGPAWLAAKPERQRGEFVIAIDRCPPASDGAGAADDEASISADRLLAGLLAELPTSRAVRLAQSLTGRPHRELYARALAMRAQAPDAPDATVADETQDADETPAGDGPPVRPQRR